MLLLRFLFLLPLSAHLPLLFVTVLFDINVVVVVAAFAVVVVAVPAQSPTHRLAHYFLWFHGTRELPLNWATPLRFRLLNLRCHTPSSSLSFRQLLLLSSRRQHLTNDPARQTRQAGGQEDPIIFQLNCVKAAADCLT